MLEMLLWVSAGLWVLFLIQTVVNWLLIPDLRKVKPRPPDRWPFVSIVVPARDEERGIREAVTSFCRQDYERFEVIVVDDRSSDRTPRILQELQGQHPNLTVIEGCDPPDGWLGKPNALEIGRKAAKGEWLLFVDADVVYGPDVLSRAIAFAMEQDLGMLMTFPLVETGGGLESVIMSSLHITVFSCLPVYMIARSKSPWFAAGGGAFNLVRRDALEACRAFESLKNTVVDDVGLGFRVKKAGHRLDVAYAGPSVRIRMYHGAREAVEGFTKNVYPMLRRFHPLLAVAPVIVGMFVSLLPYVGFVAALTRGVVSIPATVALALMHVVFASLVIRFRLPWYVMFANPVREICWWVIIVRSLIVYHHKGIVWRGRQYDNSITEETS